MRNQKFSSKKFFQVSIIIFAALLLASNSFAKYSGGSGTPADPYQIGSPNDLQTLAVDTDDYNDCFILINDINLAAYTFDRAVIAPDISSLYKFQGTVFDGVFDGNSYSIYSLAIDANENGTDYLGLFGRIGPNSTIKNLGIEDVNIIASIEVDYHAEGIGGLCGENSGGDISNCHVIGLITGHDSIGGLCGNNDGNITNCYASGIVAGSNQLIGGLCGRNYCNISNCYSTGVVTGVEVYYVGGLCGYNGGIIANCYSTSTATGDDCIGGLCGENSPGTISNCYATGIVTGEHNVGGLCGINYSTVGNSYFLNTAGPDNGFGEPLTDLQMMEQASFVDWDFTDIWNIGQSQTYPYLRQYQTGDLNKDKIVNMQDFAIFADDWLKE